MDFTENSAKTVNSAIRLNFVLFKDSYKYILIILLSTFDFYMDGVRIFDFASYCLILILVIRFLFRGGSIRLDPLMISAFVFYAFIGLVNAGQPFTIAAIFLNCILFFIFSSGQFLVEEKHVRFALLFHTCFFIAQFSLYHINGQLVNFHYWTDIEPRLLSLIFRPAGLFYEPAIFCLNIFMLLMLLPTPKSRLMLLESFAILTLVLSMSLLGFIFAMMAVVRFFRTKKKYLLIYLAITSLVSYLYVDEAYINSIFHRVLDLESDGSARSRYGGLVSIFFPLDLTQSLFGMGFGVDYEEFGGSGIGASISYVGLIGALFLSYKFLKHPAKRFTRFLALMAIALSAPIFSYAIFPFWIANLLSPNYFYNHKIKTRSN